MNLRLSDIFGGAMAYWRRDKAVLLPVSGLFFFLPVLAFQLFIMRPELPATATNEQVMETMIAWFSGNVHWMFLERLVTLFGAGVVLALLLDPTRPTLRDALGQAARRMPVLIAIWLVVTLLFLGGWMLFFVPGLYVLGRVFLVYAVGMAERRGPIDSVARGLALSRGRGWLFLLAAMVFYAGGFLLSAVAGGIAPLDRSTMAGEILGMVSDAGVALVSALVSLFVALAQAAAYARLTAGGAEAPGNGA